MIFIGKFGMKTVAKLFHRWLMNLQSTLTWLPRLNKMLKIIYATLPPHSEMFVFIFLSSWNSALFWWSMEKSFGLFTNFRGPHSAFQICSSKSSSESKRQQWELILMPSRNEINSDNWKFRSKIELKRRCFALFAQIIKLLFLTLFSVG